MWMRDRLVQSQAARSEHVRISAKSRDLSRFYRPYSSKYMAELATQYREASPSVISNAPSCASNGLGQKKESHLLAPIAAAPALLGACGCMRLLDTWLVTRHLLRWQLGT